MRTRAPTVPPAAGSGLSNESFCLQQERPRISPDVCRIVASSIYRSKAAVKKQGALSSKTALHFESHEGCLPVKSSKNSFPLSQKML
jgi:hypothetical protein